MKLSTLIPLLLAAAGMLWILLGRLSVLRRATPVDPATKEWQARFTRLREAYRQHALHSEEPGSVLVKFAVLTKRRTRTCWGNF